MEPMPLAPNDALGRIIDAVNANPSPWPMVGREDKGTLRPAKQVDLHNPNQGIAKRKSKRYAEAKAEYKEANRKVREDIFKHNFEGIAEHGIAWNHMGRAQRMATYKKLLMSNERMPKEVVQWAVERGLMKIEDR